jgi:hypothetical protein
MKSEIFDKICFKRAAILKENPAINAQLKWQFIEVDVGLLLKEREQYRIVLSACKDFIDAASLGFGKTFKPEHVVECKNGAEKMIKVINQMLDEREKS